MRPEPQHLDARAQLGLRRIGRAARPRTRPARRRGLRREQRLARPDQRRQIVGRRPAEWPSKCGERRLVVVLRASSRSPARPPPDRRPARVFSAALNSRSAARASPACRRFQLLVRDDRRGRLPASAAGTAGNSNSGKRAGRDRTHGARAAAPTRSPRARGCRQHGQRRITRVENRNRHGASRFVSQRPVSAVRQDARQTTEQPARHVGDDRDRPSRVSWQHHAGVAIDAGDPLAVRDSSLLDRSQRDARVRRARAARRWSRPARRRPRRSAPRCTARRVLRRGGGAARPASARSHLLKTSSTARPARRPRRARACTAAIGDRDRDAAASMTCSSRSASADLLERGAERRDQRVRQAIDEADGVGHQQLAAVRQPHLADQRIERHEQRVGRVRVVAASAVEQRRLAGVGVADQRDGRHRRLVAPLAQLRAAALHVVDLLRRSC